ALADVRHLGRHVKLAADAVAAEGLDDAVAVATMGKLEDRRADVADPLVGADLGDAEPQGLAGDVDELLRLGGGGAADDVHLRAVAEVAVEGGGDVDVEDVAGLEGALTRDPVTDDLVDRGADRAREALV